MVESKIEARTPDGTADCEFYAPDGAPRPGIVVFPDVLGVRPAIRDMARRFVSEGYSVLLPNLFYRASKMPVFAFEPKFGEEKTVERIGQVRPTVAPDLIARDVGPYVDTLLAQKQVKPSKVGTVGYCMGGSMAVRAAAAAPDKVAAAASFHGGQLFTDGADSPHLLLPMIKAKLYFGFAVEDRTMPVEVVEKFKAALNEAGSDWSGETYEGARHGWCIKDHNVYNAPQAERAWAKLIALFKETLG